MQLLVSHSYGITVFFGMVVPGQVFVLHSPASSVHFFLVPGLVSALKRTKMLVMMC